MFVNSGKFRSNVSAVSEFIEYDYVNKVIDFLTSQFNYGHLIKYYLDELSIPVLIFSGDQDYSTNYLG